MKPITLASLKTGSTREGDSGNSPTVKPPWLDEAKFRRGQEFFEKHFLSHLLAMHFFLVSGFAIGNLLEPLVFTGQSNTPKKALRRYLSTIQHVQLWCTDRAMWDDVNCPGFKSTQQVRNIHGHVAKAMGKKKRDDVTTDRPEEYVSQYDLGLVQAGFVFATVLYPARFGLRCSEEELEDYIHLWRGIGYLLGIADDYNTCSGNYQETYSIFKEIEREVLVPALQNPSEQSHLMSKAYIDGLNQLRKPALQSRDSMLALSYDTLGLPVPRLSLADTFYFYLFKLVMLMILWIPWLAATLNNVVQQDIKFFREKLQEEDAKENEQNDS